MGWKAFPPHRWVACVVFGWGVVSTLQAACSSWAGVMVCRVFLAMFEAAYGPGVPLYLSFFYPREKLGLRTGIFLSGSAAANAYGSALARTVSLKPEGALDRGAFSSSSRVFRLVFWLLWPGTGCPTLHIIANF